MNVLVLDAKQRSALAVTRSLGSMPGVQVTTADAAPTALAGCSRFSSRYLPSPNAETSPQDYLDWLEGVMAKNDYDLVIPVTEITSQLLLMNQQHFARLPLPFADYETVMQLADKGALMELAVAHGVPCPSSRWFASAASLDVDAETFPIVLKPCLSKIYNGEAWVATRVRVLYSKNEMLEELRISSYLHSYPFMLQEFIPGHGAGVFCLYDRGTPKVFFAHQRLREKPPQGGVSVLSESVAVDPRLRAYATKLLDAVQWHGVAMVEFRISPQGEAFLMEVNTRFWGSLQLSIDAGIDFPRLLLKAEIARKNGELSVATDHDYHHGQRLRWLLGDLDSLYIFLRSNYSLKDKVKRLLQFLLPSFRRCRHEVNRWQDMAPASHEFSLYIKQLLGR